MMYVPIILLHVVGGTFQIVGIAPSEDIVSLPRLVTHPKYTNDAPLLLRAKESKLVQLED